MRIAVLVVIILCFPIVSAASAQLTVDQDMLFTGTSSDPGTFYQDGVGGGSGNSDAGIQLCGLGQRYVGGFYAINVSGTWSSVLVTYSSSTNALALTSVDVGGGCFEANPGFVTISPSYLTTPSPTVHRAALPGKLFIGYDASANPGTVGSFVNPGDNAIFQGGYSVSRTFDQASRDIAVSTPQISFTSTSGSFSKTATDSSFGISNERRMVLGICDDDRGADCDSGTVLTTATFPQTLATGLTAGQVNDQSTNTKYVVTNGIGGEICIGANLVPEISGVTPDPVYYSQTLNFTVDLTNPRDTPFELDGGNVDITTAFDVDVVIYEQGNISNQIYSTSFEASGTLAPDGTVPVDIQWPAIAHSGTYVIEVTADANSDLTECNEADNIVTDTFELLPITIADTYIDDENTSTFVRPNVPYRLDVHMRNSDGDTLRNASVIIAETNGLSLTAPSQIYNRTINANGSTERSAIVSETRALFTTDYYGNASMTFMPTYNNYYGTDYSSLGFANYSGNYSLRLSGNESDGSVFKFVRDEIIYNYHEFNVTGQDNTSDYATKTIYRETFVAQALDFAYHTYVNFLDTIVN